MTATITRTTNEIGGGDLSSPFFYLAGPMTNLPAFNFPAFHEAAAILRQQGYNVINPAELDNEKVRAAAEASPDGKHAGTWKESLRRDIPIILNDNCVGLFVLPHWEHSEGAQFETYTAYKLRIPIFKFQGVNNTLITVNRREALYALGIDD